MRRRVDSRRADIILNAIGTMLVYSGHFGISAIAVCCIVTV